MDFPFIYVTVGDIFEYVLRLMVNPDYIGEMEQQNADRSAVGNYPDVLVIVVFGDVVDGAEHAEFYLVNAFAAERPIVVSLRPFQIVKVGNNFFYFRNVLARQAAKVAFPQPGVVVDGDWVF